MKQGGLTWLALLTSTGTLLCCALPILLISLGLGATMAALTGALPFMVTLSQHKAWVFGLSGALLGIYRRTCPADPELGALCDRAQVWNRRVYWTSVGIWGAGFFAAYLAFPLRLWLAG